MNLDLKEEPGESNPIICKYQAQQYTNMQLHQKLTSTKSSNWMSLISSETLLRNLPNGLKKPVRVVSSRVVLFKELDHRGFIIYSNFDTSKKNKDIRSNPHAALNFFWKDLQRQVRVEGIVEFVDYETSSRYFNTRPRGSKIGAHASPQSSVLKDRDELEEKYKEAEQKFSAAKDEEIPCPPKWGGIRIVPLEIEFWQGRKSRLHDRFTYTRSSPNEPWELSRLAP
ncbi:hypothetical protein KL929_004898 [Ogataea haglerorum]|nr:hypothetical protein KL929_004898 [Ogataea haglerorum]